MSNQVARWWHRLDEHRIQCDLCPRHCRLKDGQRAFCFIRQNVAGEMVLTSYGRSTGFCIDPIEKKPLDHFYPGSSVLSFGTAGCNLGCRFCQNWESSKARQVERISDEASPEAIADAAATNGCKSVAFTYNDPVIFAEYAIDTAQACRERGVKTVAVTAGYIDEVPREAFFGAMDAANVDLKAFSETFYDKLCFAKLGPVLDTLAWLHSETDVWVEVTTLLIPGRNDSADELHKLCEWFVEAMGDETPLHFSAFHPDFKLREIERTPAATLLRARQIALSKGIKHVYTGNVPDDESQSSYCAGCGACVIERSGYTIGAYYLDGQGHCQHCGYAMAGRFDERARLWGGGRRRIRPGAPT